MNLSTCSQPPADGAAQAGPQSWPTTSIQQKIADVFRRATTEMFNGKPALMP